MDLPVELEIVLFCANVICTLSVACLVTTLVHEAFRNLGDGFFVPAEKLVPARDLLVLLFGLLLTMKRLKILDLLGVIQGDSRMRLLHFLNQICRQQGLLELREAKLQRFLH